MRLWASCDSITLDEFAPRLGELVQVALGFEASYFGGVGKGRSRSGLPVDMSALGERGFVQLPELGRTECAMTGTLMRGEAERPRDLIESLFTVNLHGPLERYASNQGTLCQALGKLHLSGKAMVSAGKVYYQARIHRFQSLCLKADDPRFGTWIEIQRYGDLGSDPDVIGAAVCVAEFDLFLSPSPNG